jgi:hypothetical protein
MIPFLEILCNPVTELNNGAGVVTPNGIAFARAINGWHVCVSPIE